MVLRLAGELDANTVEEFRQIAAQALDEPGYPPILVDLHGLSFVDSTGLNAFVWLHRSGAKAHRRVVWARPTENVRRILGVVGLDRVFGFTDELPETPCPICDVTLPREARWCPACRSRLG